MYPCFWFRKGWMPAGQVLSSPTAKPADAKSGGGSAKRNLGGGHVCRLNRQKGIFKRGFAKRWPIRNEKNKPLKRHSRRFWETGKDGAGVPRHRQEVPPASRELSEKARMKGENEHWEAAERP